MVYIATLTPIICSVITLIGVIITNKKSTALTNYKVEELTQEFKKLNEYYDKIPLIELQIKSIPEMQNQININKTNIAILLNKGVNNYDTQ